MKRTSTRFLVTGALVAALYALLTYVSAALNLAYGTVQFRLSEALTVLPVVSGAAVPGLVIGCLLGNLTSPYGLVDIICGTGADAAGRRRFAAVRPCEIARNPGRVAADADRLQCGHRRRGNHLPCAGGLCAARFFVCGAVRRGGRGCRRCPAGNASAAVFAEKRPRPAFGRGKMRKNTGKTKKLLTNRAERYIIIICTVKD